MVQAEMNLYLSLQSHFYVKYKKWKHNQQPIITVRLILTQALENDDEQYSGISIKRTPLVQKMCPLYRDFFRDSLTEKQSNPLLATLSAL